MKRLIAALSKLGLTGQEIADVVWLSSQRDEEGIIDISVDTDSGQETSDPADADARTTDPSSQPSTQDTAQQSHTNQADIVPSPVEQPPGLAFPKNYKPIPVPDAPAISQALQLARALRPLARQIAVGLPTMMDEEATADFIAETGVWLPVLKAEPELWLDVALVFDTSPSMCLWQRFGTDLHRLLARYGEFRDVRIWRLEHTDRTVTFTSRKGMPRKPSELLTGDRRRLVVIVSDCVAPAWHNGQMRDLIATWSEKLPAVVFQVFPERLWSRTALARSAGVELQAKQEGCPSDQLRPKARSVWQHDRLQATLKQSMVRLPVVTLEQSSLSGWARVVAGDRRARVLGIVWDAPSVDFKSEEQASPTVPSLQDQLDTFVLRASPLARQLARLLVSAPVITLPIVRLIKQANLKQASSVHIAEVFMSGLLKVSGDHKPTFENAEKIVYELVDDEVRDRLRAGSQVDEALRVYQKVSEHIAQGLGRSVAEFWALLRIPLQGESSEETEFLNAFASVTAKVLRGLGSEFEAIADSLTQLPASSEEHTDAPDWLVGFPLEDYEYEVAQYLNLPPLESFEFIEAQLEGIVFPPPLATEDFTIVTVEPQDDTPELESFPFIVATVHRRQRQQQQQQQPTEWEILRETREAHRFLQPLAGIPPIEMVAIPGGTFLMGSPDDEPNRSNYESPQHEVTVAPFFMGAYPVTQRQWRAIAELPQIERELAPDPSRFKGLNHPVEQVSWYDAVEFCARLSAFTDRQYRLPSEAEWEYACRAGTTTPFHFGETISAELANYRASSTYNGGPKGEYRKETTSIDRFGIANAFGLSDMHGNVLEWCQDHFHSDYKGAPTDGSAWIEGGDSNRRILRGGSWYRTPRYCRSAYRYVDGPGGGFNIGFRVVCSAPRALQRPTG